MANPWIDKAIDQVHHQIDEDKGSGEDEQHPLHHRNIALTNRGNQQPPHARPGENRLGDYRAAEHIAKAQADYGDNRQEGIAQRVADQDHQLRYALGPCRAHIIFLQCLKQRRPRHARNKGERKDGKGHRRHNKVPPTAVAGAGQHPQFHAKEPHHEQTQPKDRNRNTQECDNRKENIPEAVAIDRRDHPHRHAEDRGRHNRNQRKFDSIPEAIANLDNHWSPRKDRYPQVAARQARDIADILHQRWLIQPQVFARRFYFGQRGIAARIHLRRIAGDELEGNKDQRYHQK